jgi:hypothetical protein
VRLKWILVAVLLGSVPTAAPAQQQPAKPEVVLPDADKIVLLIRTALLTLNDAVQTGNFTVLRDKGSPSFQAANTAAKLGMIFQNLVRQGVDLSAVSIITPQLGEGPTIDANGRLSLKGHFPGTPVRIDFDLLYESVAGRWRLFGISVAPAATGAPGAPAAAQPKADTPAKDPADEPKKK